MMVMIDDDDDGDDDDIALWAKLAVVRITTHASLHFRAEAFSQAGKSSRLAGTEWAVSNNRNGNVYGEN